MVLFATSIIAVFVDASKEFLKVTNNNKLTEENIANIVEAYTDRADKQYMVKVASYDDVKSNDFNLSVSTYVEQEDTREEIDIDKINAELEEIVARECKLREEINKIINEIGTANEQDR